MTNRSVLPGLRRLHQLHAALRESARCDVGTLHRRFPPTIRVWVGLWIELVHDAARLLNRYRDEALALIPVLVEDVFVLGFETIESARFFKRDLELGQV